MLKVAVTDDRFGSYDIEKSVLKDIAEIKVINSSSIKSIKKDIQDADALLVNQFKMTADIINSLGKCKVISRYGTGYDNVDLKAATAKKILVTRVPDYCYDEVAEHAVAMMLACTRKLSYIDRKVRKFLWNIHSNEKIYRIKGKTLGIIGYGGTGKCFHNKISGFGFSRILISDHHVSSEDISDPVAEISSIENIFREADVISLHIPLRDENKHLLDKDTISMMKSEAVIINTSRGSIINENDLYEALKNRRIAGAGLDVFEQEPPFNTGKLFKLDNIVLSDHSAYYSEESIYELKYRAASNIRKVFEGNIPEHTVNKNEIFQKIK